jgi:cell volume regulation protein A
MQISMFMLLGLQVFPSQLLPVVSIGLVVAAFLILVARPVSVFLGLSLSPLNLREKTLISWVGLRGAVPIILATFPLLAGIERAETIFNLVFFIVLTSAIIQGSTIPLMARWLNLEAAPAGPAGKISLEGEQAVPGSLHRISVAPDSPVADRQLVDVCLPRGVLVVYIERHGQHLVPGGSTTVRAGDTLYLLADTDTFSEVELQLAAGTCPPRSTD